MMCYNKYINQPKEKKMAAQFEQLEKALTDLPADVFNELMRSVLSGRSDESLDWSTGFAVETTVGDTTYTVEQ